MRHSLIGEKRMLAGPEYQNACVQMVKAESLTLYGPAHFPYVDPQNAKKVTQMDSPSACFAWLPHQGSILGPAARFRAKWASDDRAHGNGTVAQQPRLGAAHIGGAVPFIATTMPFVGRG